MGVISGILAVRHECARTLVIVSCLDSTWKVLQKRAVDSFRDRFEQPIENLRLISEARTPKELIALRLDETYRAAGFTPPYRTWPFAAGFFASTPNGLTPRDILNRCERHRLSCVAADKVTELNDYGAPDPLPGRETEFSDIEARFSEARASVDSATLLDESNEDVLGDLLGEAAQLFRRELPFDPNVDFAVETDFHETKQYESLHLRMRRIFRSEGDREEHVCVRILQKANHTSFRVRLTAALTTSGVSEMLEGRRLFLVRNSDMPPGPATARMVEHAKECGATFIPLEPEDVKVLSAVVKLAQSGEPRLEGWLLSRRPLSETHIFRQLVPTWLGLTAEIKPAAPIGQHSGGGSKVDGGPAASNSSVVASTDIPMPCEALTGPTTTRQGIFLGSRLEAGAAGDPVYLPAVDLTRHVLIRAGSGGGKTVFIKRLIEEAALNGISSIVIDTAKDLSMLGDRWQQPPPGWSEEDAKRADRYFSEVDVRIWTPGHSGGKPLRLAPLPNLTGPFPEKHDRDQVVQVAVAGLLPLAVQKRNPTVEKAILTKVVEWLTRQPQHGGSELERLIAALRDLPGETFQGYLNERKLAAGMADQIKATSVADPLYGGQGEDLDPAKLFGVGVPRPRISILSLFAMPDINTQARFIGQLASELFNWIRRNPTPAGSEVRGLLVLDEAARFLPRNNAESKAGLMLLAQQARKYGLGLVLATQNPMDLDYNATANFATQLFGTANANQVVKFIKEAMEQRGLRGMDPGKLKTGEFFCATPSISQPICLRGAMCLSAHPNNVQLSDDDIVARALRNP